MLKTERNNKTMGLRVLRAFRKHFAVRARSHSYSADFEHGQWWITYLLTGAQWPVCDADGVGSTDGFCFERVTQGDEA